MMENMRRQGASFVIYIIFGALIAAFVINFGPQSKGSSGCGSDGAANSYLTVGTNAVSLGSYRFAATIENKNVPATLRALTRRELLAQAAEARGIRVSDAMVDEQLKAGNVYMGGELRTEFKAALTDTVENETYFNFEKLKGIATNYFGMSVAQFKDQQRRELQAHIMEELLRESVRASRDEARQEFDYEGTTVTFDAVLFARAAYAKAMQLTDADIARFVASHDAEVRAAFTAEERSYKGTKAAVMLRQIFVAKPVAPTPPVVDDAAGSGSGSAAAAPTPTAEAKVDLGQATLASARADILAKKKTFAELAATLNSDPVDRANQGRLGFRTQDAAKLPDAALNDAVKALKVGDVSEVISTSTGHWLLTLEDKREGDLGYDQVKDELGAKLARDAYAKEAARGAALAALTQARDGAGKNLADLFEKAPVRQDPSGDTENILRLLQDPNTPQATKDAIMQMLQQNMGGGAGNGETGWLEPARRGLPDGTYLSPVVRASWTAAVADGSAAAGSGSGAVAATISAPAPVPATDVMAPVTMQLPAFGTLDKPKVESIGPMPRTRGEIAGLGTSKVLVTTLFDKLMPGMLAPQIFAVDRGFVLVQLSTKESPDTKAFEADADARVLTLTRERGQGYVRQWLTARCDALVKDGKLTAAKSVLRTEDADGKPVETPFSPCQF